MCSEACVGWILFGAQVKGACICAQWCPTLCDPMDCSLPGSSVRGVFQARYWSGLPFHIPGIKPRFPALQADCLPSEPPGKPKNTGVGGHSLLQGIFPTGELNQVSCIAGVVFTSWTTREAHSHPLFSPECRNRFIFHTFASGRVQVQLRVK